MIDGEYDWLRVKRFLIFILAAGLITSLILYIYQSLIVPIGISVFLTYLLIPLVEKLDSFLPRTVVVSLLLVTTILLVSFAVIRLFPVLYKEVLHLILQIPTVVDVAINSWLPYLREMVGSSKLIDEQDFDKLISEIASVSQVSEKAVSALSTIWSSFPKVLGTVINLVMTPLITFFLLLHWERIKGFLGKYVPVDLKSDCKRFFERVDETLSSVIKGQITVAGILAGLYILGFSIIGLDAAVVIGLVSGVCRIVPYLDIIVGGSLSLVAVLSHFQSVGQIVGVVIVFVVVQTLDGMLITPRVIGERAGLHPAVVIVSVIAFGSFWGFWGVILAIPLVAVVKSLWLAATPYYFASKLYSLDAIEKKRILSDSNLSK